MSKPANTSTTTTVSDPNNQHLALIREYHKGNWTLHETITLITAKKLDEERRIKASSTTTAKHSRSGELRWKWVENYCWNHGCFRSQNQCNDKWDNLLRDFKKVRHYQSRSHSSQHLPSYWHMERHQRKDRNLPSNLASEVFQTLNDVVHKIYPPRTAPGAQPSSSAGHSPVPLTVRPRPPAAPSVSDRSEKYESETKRRKVRSIGSSILRSASVLARTLRSCEEKKEKRHGEVMELEERRLQIEETRNEVKRQGISDLVVAVSNLSGAILSLVSDHHNPT